MFNHRKCVKPAPPHRLFPLTCHSHPLHSDWQALRCWVCVNALWHTSASLYISPSIIFHVFNIHVLLLPACRPEILCCVFHLCFYMCSGKCSAWHQTVPKRRAIWSRILFKPERPLGVLGHSRWNSCTQKFSMPARSPSNWLLIDRPESEAQRARNTIGFTAESL